MTEDILKQRYNHILANDYGLAPTDRLLSEMRINQNGKAWTSWGTLQKDIGILIQFNTDELEPDE